MADEQSSDVGQVAIDLDDNLTDEARRNPTKVVTGFAVRAFLNKSKIVVQAMIRIDAKPKFVGMNCRNPELALKIAEEMMGASAEICQHVISGTDWKDVFSDELKREWKSERSEVSASTPDLTKRLREDLRYVREQLKTRQEARREAKREQPESDWCAAARRERLQKRIEARRRPIEQRQLERRRLRAERKAEKLAQEKWRRMLPTLKRPWRVRKRRRKTRTPIVDTSRHPKGKAKLCLSERIARFRARPSADHALGRRELRVVEGPLRGPRIRRVAGATRWHWDVFHYLATESNAVHRLRISCRTDMSAIVWFKEPTDVIQQVVDEIIWKNASKVWKSIQTQQIRDDLPVCEEWQTLAGFVRHWGPWNFVGNTGLFVVDSRVGFRPGNCLLGQVSGDVLVGNLDDCPQIIPYLKQGLCSMEQAEKFTRLDTDPHILIEDLKQFDAQSAGLTVTEKKTAFRRLLNGLCAKHQSIAIDEFVTRWNIIAGMQREKQKSNPKTVNQPDTYLEKFEAMQGPSTDELLALEHEPVAEQTEEELAVL